MTFFAPDQTSGSRTSGPPIRRPPRAQGWAGRDVILVLLWVGFGVGLYVWWRDTPAASLNNRGELLIAAGRILGLAAGYLLLLVVLVRSRVGVLERLVGAETLSRWHRDFGGVLVVTVLAHASLILVGYAVLDDVAWLRELGVLMNEYEDMTSAVVAVCLLVGIGLLAIRGIRAALPYELWKLLHLSSYLVLLLTYGHQFADGQQLFRPGLGRTYWVALYVVVLAALAWGRLIGPLLYNLGHGFRVADVVDEGPDVISIYLSGRRLRTAGRAGQFFRWRFLAPGVWLQAHPFSLSAAANGRWLRLTVKTVGSHTTALRGLRTGTRVWAQGPMGSFTAARRTRGRALLIAGGIGIGPIRALLEELPLGASVIYRASSVDDVVLRTELDRIAELRDADVWYVLGSRYDAAPRALLTAGGMLQIVPDVKNRDVYLCGPHGFVRAARAALRSAGVPRRQLHDTLFEF